MSTLTATRTSASVAAARVRHTLGTAASQPLARQKQTTNRPRFLIVLLRALSSLAA